MVKLAVLDNIADFIRHSAHVYCVPDQFHTFNFHQRYISQFRVENSASIVFLFYITLAD